jgi:hypothetical protein
MSFRAEYPNADDGHGGQPGAGSRSFAMTAGPVQLIVLGFAHPEVHHEVVSELRRLADAGVVRIVDSAVVRKDRHGRLRLDPDASAELHHTGVIIDGPAVGGVEAFAAIPNDTMCVVVLIEHRWAVSLRDAVVRAGGFSVLSKSVSPLELMKTLATEDSDGADPAE